jgi:hypothetical protein
MKTAEWHIERAESLLESIDYRDDTIPSIQAQAAQAAAHAAVAQAMNTRRRVPIGGPY